MATATQQKYIWGTGRRKSAVARVRVRPGTGTFLVNGRELNAALPTTEWQVTARGPLTHLEAATKYDVIVNADGGGGTGQAGAIAMGVARALLKLDPALEVALRASGFLTRDARMKERKKYGKAGARRSFQFSKR